LLAPVFVGAVASMDVILKLSIDFVNAVCCVAAPAEGVDLALCNPFERLDLAHRLHGIVVP
jgi:hypothetical protein